MLPESVAKINNNTENTKTCMKGMKQSGLGQSTMVIPQGQCPVQGFRKYSLLNLVPKVAWEHF